VVQNKALRPATGCHASASADHVHAETQILPVHQHLCLLATQLFARAMQEHHPSHAIALRDRGRRAMKHTLRSKVGEDVEPFLVNGVMRAGDFPRALKDIHTKIVGEAVDDLQPNRVLLTAPPLVDPSESYLPRATRSTLSQLRSGHCARLQSYLHRLGRVDSDLCPECRGAPHTAVHLFVCPNHPTDLVLTDLSVSDGTLEW